MLFSKFNPNGLKCTVRYAVFEIQPFGFIAGDPGSTELYCGIQAQKYCVANEVLVLEKKDVW